MQKVDAQSRSHRHRHDADFTKDGDVLRQIGQRHERGFQRRAARPTSVAAHFAPYSGAPIPDSRYREFRPKLC